jgi:histidine phosphotransferase ChpT
MTEPSRDLAGLIGSRICHDLVSPIGAIGNGLELLSLSAPAPGSPEMALISESCANAQARIRFYRLAFGTGASDQRIGAAEARALAADYLAGGRLALRWEVEEDLARPDVQLGFLALLCLETAMPMGGELRIGREAGRWRLDGTAPRLRAEPALWDGLALPRGPGEVTPASVQFALLAVQAAAARRAIDVEMAEDRIAMAV